MGEVKTAAARRRPSWVGTALLAAVVLTLLTLLIVSELTLSEDEGANIGGGFCLLMLLAIGLPWSVPAFAVDDGFPGWTYPWVYLVFLAPPFVNVALHAAWTRHRRRR